MQWCPRSSQAAPMMYCTVTFNCNEYTVEYELLNIQLMTVQYITWLSYCTVHQFTTMFTLTKQLNKTYKRLKYVESVNIKIRLNKTLSQDCTVHVAHTVNSDYQYGLIDNMGRPQSQVLSVVTATCCFFLCLWRCSFDLHLWTSPDFPPSSEALDRLKSSDL